MKHLRIRKRYIIGTVIVSVAVLLSLPNFITTAIAELVETSQTQKLMREQMLKMQEKTKLITELADTKQKLKTIEIEKFVNFKIAEERKQKIIDLLVCKEITWVYQEAGKTKDYHWATSDNILFCLQCIRKYKHLSGLKETDKFDVEAYCLAWIMTESHFSPNTKEQNKDGTWDYGIMRLNERCKCWFKGDDWRNPEYNIKAWMFWAKDRINRGWFLRPKDKPLNWGYYDRIIQCKKRNL